MQSARPSPTSLGFNQFSRQRPLVVENALYAHQKGQKVFWEVFSGSANLAHRMSHEGRLVECLDLEEL